MSNRHTNDKQKETLKNLRESLQALYKAAECPVCLEVIPAAGGSRLCTLGHGVCSSCADKLEACPICKKPLSIKDPVMVNNLLEALPRFCRYSTAGCPQLLVRQTSGEDLHERFCGFQEAKCSKCLKQILTCKMLEHYETHHLTCIIARDTKCDIKFWNVNRSNYFGEDRPVFLFGKMFYLRLRYNERIKYNVSFFALPDVEDDEFYVRVTLEKGNFVYTHVLKAIQSAYPFEFDPKNDVFQYVDDKGRTTKVECIQKYCFKIPQETVNQFIDENGTLCFQAVFFREEKESEK